MFVKSKFALAAALVFGSASLALAQSGEEIQNSAYQLNPNASVPIFADEAPRTAALIEGRNVSVQPAAQAADPLKSFGGY